MNSIDSMKASNAGSEEFARGKLLDPGLGIKEAEDYIISIQIQTSSSSL